MLLRPPECLGRPLPIQTELPHLSFVSKLRIFSRGGPLGGAGVSPGPCHPRGNGLSAWWAPGLLQKPEEVGFPGTVPTGQLTTYSVHREESQEPSVDGPRGQTRQT